MDVRFEGSKAMNKATISIIKFNNRYKKMPPLVEYSTTYVTDVHIIDSADLTEWQIKQDTETVDGHFYKLPTGRLILVNLWTETINGGKSWSTLRAFTQGVYDYYRSLRGQEIQIVIKKEAVCPTGSVPTT